MSKKVCGKCDQLKDLEEFWNNKLGKDGKDWMCISCRKLIAKDFRNREKENFPTGKGKGRKPKEVPNGTKWCSYHKSPCPETNFTGREKMCSKGKYLDHIKRKYGMSSNLFEELIQKQNNVCAICSNSWKYVDHNHTTGKVRGLLCPRCNTLVGFLETSGDNIGLALDYIARNENLGEE